MSRISAGPSPNTCQAMFTPSCSRYWVRGVSIRWFLLRSAKRRPIGRQRFDQTLRIPERAHGDQPAVPKAHRPAGRVLRLDTAAPASVTQAPDQQHGRADGESVIDVRTQHLPRVVEVTYVLTNTVVPPVHPFLEQTGRKWTPLDIGVRQLDQARNITARHRLDDVGRQLQVGGSH